MINQASLASLVKLKEGTFSVPSVMKYLIKHMKRCLSKVDKYPSFWGNDYPRSMIQS